MILFSSKNNEFYEKKLKFIKGLETLKKNLACGAIWGDPHLPNY